MSKCTVHVILLLFILCSDQPSAVLFLLCMNQDMLAPPIKQKARFKIKDAKCHLRPRNKEKHRDSSKQNPQGE